jgi:hypothetical protein
MFRSYSAWVICASWLTVYFSVIARFIHPAATTKKRRINARTRRIPVFFIDE